MNNGWAVEEGILDLKNVVSYLRDNVTRPDRTILWGLSLGTTIGFASMERFSGIYDGMLGE